MRHLRRAGTANFKVGVADQDAAMFDSAKFEALKVKRVRYLVPYDWYKYDFQVAEVVALP